MSDNTAPRGALLPTPVFTTPVTNPYGLTNGSNYANASFVDIDGDGDLDAFIGATAGETRFYLNTGSSSSPAFSAPVVNSFGLLDSGSFSSPNFVDIDADGDLDALIGFRDGIIRLQLNTGTSSSPAFNATATANPFGLSDVGNSAQPSFVDIDADGDLDALIGINDGNTLVFLNTGTAGAAAFAAPLTNPYGLGDVGDYANVNLADIDGDGDLDVFIGEFLGNTYFFQNTGTASSPAFAPGVTNPFGLTDVGSSSSASFVDIDGDGDLDALLGNRAGNTQVFINSANPVAPVTSAAANGTYGVDSVIAVTVEFNENVLVNTVGGTPTLLLETGTTDRNAVYASGSGTKVLTFNYTVQAGDSSADLTQQSANALVLNGGTIKDAAGNDAILTLAEPTAAGSLGANKALVIDGVEPTVTSVNASTANGTYKAGDTVSVQVNFSEAVSVTGTPQLTLETGTTDRVVNYASGSGTSALTFTYTVQAGDTSADLDYQSTTALALNSGTIRDTAGNNATLTLASPGAANSLGNNKALVIDGVAPSLTGDTVPANGTFVSGQNLDFTVSYDEAVTVTGAPSIALTLDTGGTVQATYLSGSGTGTLTFRYTVVAGNKDTNGIAVASSISLNGGTLSDAAGNTAAATGITFASTAGVLVDAAGPSVSSIVRAGGSATTKATSVDYTVTFSEAVTGVDTSDFALSGAGVTGTVSGITGSGTTYTVTVSGVTGDGTLRLDLKNSGTGIVNGSSNPIASGYSAGQSYTIDNTPPAVPATPVLAPASDLGFLNSDKLTSDATPTLSGTAEADSTVTLYDTGGATVLGTAIATGGVWSIASSALAEGAHTLTVKATDAVGNTGAASNGLDVTIDTTAPTLGITSNVSTLKIGETATITFTFSEDPGSTFHWDTKVGDVAVTGGTLGTISGAGLTRTATFTPTASTNAGTASITVATGTYTDAAGNNGGAGITPALTFDTLAPNAPSTPDLDAASDSGTSSIDNTTKLTTPTFTGTAEAGSTVTLYDTDGTTVLGTTVAAGGTWSITSTTLAEGVHTLTTKATDVAGNVGAPSAGLVVTIDTTPPAGSSPPDLHAASDSGASSTDNVTAVTTPTFTGTAGLNANVTLYDTDGTTVLGNTNADGAGHWTITSTALAAGAHTLTAKASDLAGNASAASLGLDVTVDPDAPAFTSATVNGSTLVMTYADASTLDAANIPAPGAFTVMVGATPNTVTAVAVNAAAKTVTLTLTTPVAVGNVVTVAYTDPGVGNDTLAIQDAAGNDAATLAATAVTNTTSASGGGGGGGDTPPGTTIDGVPVVTEPGPGGSTVVTIPVVVPTRPEVPGTPTPLADIPIVKALDGHPILQVSVPTGVGLQAEGLSSSTSGTAALAELGFRIERVTGNSPELTNAGQVFYATLAPNEPLTVQILKPTIGANYNPATPLVINGSTNPADGKQAVIIDARSLPSGTVIQVDNIDFIAVVGNVRLIGGAGQNAASGDGAAQWIVLGPDDDIIHGGAGNDTVGSLGGNDQLYGDAGDDTVFGGEGHDLLSGGTGSDRLNGGTGFDVALQEGKRTDYTVTLEGHGIRLTHTATGVSDWLVDVEQVRFETGPVLTVAHSAAEEAAAFLFQKWMGRELSQAEGAVVQTLTGQSALQVTALFAQVFPQQAAGKTPAQLLDGMASAGAIRVDAVREVTIMGDAGDNTITPTLGLARYVDGGPGIDTVVIPATLAQTHIQSNGSGTFTLQRMTDGAMLDLTSVERIRLSDTQLALDLNGHAGEAARLLGALGGPTILGNKGLVGEVIRALDAGASAQSLAGLGLQALGAQTPGQVAQLLWTNVMGRTGTQAELQPLVDLMGQGVTGAELAVLAGNLDLNATRIDLVGLTAKGIEFA